VSTLLVTIGILTIIILLAYQTQPVSNQMTNIIGKFNGNFKQYKNSLIFYDDNFSFKNFSIFVVFAAIFRPFFNVGDPYVTRYLFWQQVITFGIIFSCTITGFFYQRINLCNYLLIPFILIVTLITLTFSFMFFESPIIGCSWIAIPIILYCYQTFQRPYRDDRLINNVLLVMVIGFTALDVDLTLITILLFLFNFCYSSMKNLNPVGQFLYCFFPFLYVFFL
jgi:hypothetical protein